jgi:hypothetical protein
MAYEEDFSFDDTAKMMGVDIGLDAKSSDKIEEEILEEVDGVIIEEDGHNSRLQIEEHEDDEATFVTVDGSTTNPAMRGGVVLGLSLMVVFGGFALYKSVFMPTGAIAEKKGTENKSGDIASIGSTNEKSPTSPASGTEDAGVRTVDAPTPATTPPSVAVTPPATLPNSSTSPGSGAVAPSVAPIPKVVASNNSGSKIASVPPVQPKPIPGSFANVNRDNKVPDPSNASANRKSSTASNNNVTGNRNAFPAPTKPTASFGGDIASVGSKPSNSNSAKSDKPNGDNKTAKVKASNNNVTGNRNAFPAPTKPTASFGGDIASVDSRPSNSNRTGSDRPVEIANSTPVVRISGEDIYGTVKPLSGNNAINPSTMEAPPPALNPNTPLNGNNAIAKDQGAAAPPLADFLASRDTGNSGNQGNEVLPTTIKTDPVQSQPNNKGTTPYPDNLPRTRIEVASRELSGGAFRQIDFSANAPQLISANVPNVKENKDGSSPAIKDETGNGNNAPPPEALGQEISPQQPPQVKGGKLLVGGSVRAKTATNIIWGKGGGNGDDDPLYIIELTEQLIDSQGKMALPIGTKMIVSVKGLEGQFASMTPKSIIINNQEYSVPKGLFSVRAENGEPVSGDDVYNRDGGIDVLSIGLGIASEVGTNLTRPNVTVTSTSISEQSNPNLFGAVLKGATGSTLSQLSKANDARIARAAKMPEVYRINAGTSLKIFINQSYGG